MSPTRTQRALAMLVAAGCAAIGIALAVGSVWVAPLDAATELQRAARGLDPIDRVTAAITVDLRLPRVTGMFVVGGLLAAAGALLQLVLATPLADPYVLGASGGAGVGALLALVLGVGVGASAPAAFAGALVATVATLWLGRSIGGMPVHLLLAGLCVSALTGALLSLLLLGSGPRGAAPALAWLLGGVVPSSWLQIGIGAAALVLVVAVAVGLGRSIDVLTLGDEDAAALGVHPRLVRLLVVACCALATGSAVSLAGLVGFVGALVPIGARAWLPAGARVSVPACALVGGSVLVLVDAVARTVRAPVELPTGVVAACIGAPIVVLLVRGEAVTRARI